MAEDRPAERLRGVDAARGVALLGMMAIHVLPARDPDGARSTAYVLAHGRSAAAFAVLAGVGLALATARSLRSPNLDGRLDAWLGDAAALTVRALAIGAVGLALGYPDSGVAVILPYYGMFFLLAIPLLRLRPGALAALAVATAVLVPATSHLLRADLPPARVTNPTFDTLAQDPGALLVELGLTGYYPVLAWTTYLCAGLAVGRLPLRSPRVAALLFGGGLALAAGSWLASRLLLNVFGGREHIAASLGVPEHSPEMDRVLSGSQYGTTPTTTWWWLAVDTPHSSTPLDLLHTTGTALALVGATLLLARPAGAALAPLAAAGAMTLTLYTAHVLALSTSLLPSDPTTSYVVQAIAVVGVATAWRVLWRRGPLEQAIASIAGGARKAVTTPPGTRLDT